MARYETGTGKDKRFWEIIVSGDEFYTRHGRVGGDGKVGTRKQFASPAEAGSAADKSVKAKVKQGYKRVDEVVGEHARNPDLEAAIAVDPYDDGGYLVYADWLQEQGDPRGGLASLQQARAGSPDGSRRQGDLAIEEEGFARKHRNALLPARLRKFLGQPWGKGRGCALEWRGGFVHQARVERHSDRSPHTLRELIQLLLAHPSCRLVAELALGAPGVSRPFDYEPAVDAVGEAAPLALRALHIGDFDTASIPLDASHAGSLAALARVPRLERLTLHVGSTGPLASDDVPGLRYLAITTASLDADMLAGLQSASWPVLEGLVIDVAAMAMTPGDLADSLAGVRVPVLRALSLRGTTITAEMVPVLTEASWWSGLEKVDLSGGSLDDSHVDLLLGQGEALKHLVRLDLSRNFLSDEGVKAVAGLCRHVNTADQRPPVAAPVSITAEAVARFSPNNASMGRAQKLAVPGKWPDLGNDNGVLWGRCRGSTVYDVYADPGLMEAGCTCPSPLYPCKHSLALLLLATRGVAIPAIAAPRGFIEACQDARYDSVWE